MYHNAQMLLALARERNQALWQVVLENERRLTGLAEEEIFRRLKERFLVMDQGAERALRQPLETVGGLIDGISATQQAYVEQGQNSLSGPFVNQVMAWALSSCEVNASMGKICAAPTAGACGILPAVLKGVALRHRLEEGQILEGLLTASGLGAIITRNATVSGAEGGCQAECGSAAAMAAAAAVEMSGGTPAQALEAASLAFMNVLGLVCDPVAGLVAVPCAVRNAIQSVQALACADLAMGGMVSPIPLDEVIEAMYRVGRMLPYQLRETALGGLAATTTGKELAKKILGGHS